MQMNKNENIRHGNRKAMPLFLIFFMAFLMTAGMSAEAATTCKSAMSYPAVTKAKVNMRKKAGTKYKSYGTLNKNAEVTLLGYVTNKGQTWYKCKGKIKGKTKTGYVSAAYIKKDFNPTGVVNKKVGSYLNVRKSAKTSSKSLMKIPKNTNLTVKSIKKVSNKYWYKVTVTYKKKKKTGYVLSTYVDVKKNGKNDVSDKTDAKTTTPTNSKPDSNQPQLEGYVNEKVTTSLNVRKNASTKSAILVSIPAKTAVIILETSGDWYKVKVTYNKKTVTGYVSKTYITIKNSNSTNNSNNSNSNNNNNTNSNTDTSFETLIGAFPESYKSKLRTLHTQYPNWRFVAVNTGLDWDTVIKNESTGGRNVIQSNYPRGTSSLAPFSYLSTASGAYDWSQDKYVVKDGSNWYTASSKVVSYYMDPRNFLTVSDIFQFEALAYDASHSASVVQSILNNTFMKGNYSVVDSATKKTVSGSYTQAFMDAGVGAQASPYFLASRSKQEVGVNGSAATSGTYKGYEGIYNFYNIGAFDGGDAVAKGLQWARTGTAYGKPWTNPYKSIVGGAKYIAENYIKKGQNTLYLQKFNVKPANASDLYAHQYMTNVQAPYSEGRTTQKAYNALGILSDTMIFYIPVYKNMPSSACALPAKAGNPNPFLSGITVKNGNSTVKGLTPSFTKPTSGGVLSNNTYTIVVEKTVSSVTINATPISKYASVSGTGNHTLGAKGTTTKITLTCVAQNGAKQQYIVNVTRKK